MYFNYHTFLRRGDIFSSFFQLLIGQVQNILENAEIPELVLITGKIFHLLMEEYIEVFTDFFKVRTRWWKKKKKKRTGFDNSCN